MTLPQEWWMPNDTIADNSALTALDENDDDDDDDNATNQGDADDESDSTEANDTDNSEPTGVNITPKHMNFQEWARPWN